MDRFALYRALGAARVPAASYEIVDCPGSPLAADRYFLDGRAGDWAVGVHERGTREVFERFADEDAACRWMYDRLVATEPASVPEEPAGRAPDPEALQRQADDDLEAALAAMRRRTEERSGDERPGGSAEGAGPA
ncbi:hypothetical protein [Streptomyces triticiradicis]|uniref:Uncharacterized protein n=1 Tax=Streptomyces triticiradicis TaxID=2651189 RepID=A0A7J5DCM6_9ACTN|nr:hypothetical protein [Streptomyces triticiradicis]KAB1985581.1 hypothetical protein F8144_26500 [Streptomyces triticiradicis]